MSPTSTRTGCSSLSARASSGRVSSMLCIIPRCESLQLLRSEELAHEKVVGGSEPAVHVKKHPIPLEQQSYGVVGTRGKRELDALAQLFLRPV